MGQAEPKTEASSSRKKPLREMTKSAWPNRSSTRSRRLERTESPTNSAPPSTPTAVETPSSTARFVRQYHVRLRASRVEVRMTQLVPDGEPGGQLCVVRYHHQDGLLPLVQLEQQRSHHIGRRLIEVARRLVAEQQKRLPDQGTRQRYALLLAARKLGGAMVQRSEERRVGEDGRTRVATD